jgi:hypothetical protein
VPLWFLATYALVIDAHPIADRCWQRNRTATAAGLLAVVLIGDMTQLISGLGAVALLNHIWVFMVCQLFGVLWFEGRLPSGLRAAATALGSLANGRGDVEPALHDDLPLALHRHRGGCARRTVHQSERPA